MSVHAGAETLNTVQNLAAARSVGEYFLLDPMNPLPSDDMRESEQSRCRTRYVPRLGKFHRDRRNTVRR